MPTNRRSFLSLAGAFAAGAMILPRPRRSRAGTLPFKTKRVVILGIAGGLRRAESLGMAEGATMPNLFGTIPRVPGFGAGDAGAPRIAPEYAAAALPLVIPNAAATPLADQGALVTNLRYAEGAPGHLQGQACLVTGAYNNIDNRPDAKAPSPTLFELVRRETGAPATGAWYVSVLGGFYRALIASAHPEYGARFGGSLLAPPLTLSAALPLVTSGQRSLTFDGISVPSLPVITDQPEEAAATRRLAGILDGNSPAWPEDGTFRTSSEDALAIEDHLASFYADPTYQAYYPASVGIGVRNPNGDLAATNDALTVYHAEQILKKFKPAIMAVTLLDIDACHSDFNGYLRGQVVADACVRHLWETIQSTEGLRDETTLLVLPEHGRHLFMNGQNPDSLGRSGIDHGQGDDGDRDVWMLALGPDIRPGTVVERTDVPARPLGRYETIDVVTTAAHLLGVGGQLTEALESSEERAGLVISEVLA